MWRALIKRSVRVPIMATKNFIKYIRKGGVVYVNVSQVAKGDVLKGRRALVTGGTSGIGFAIAQKFLSEGARIVITGRTESRLNDAVLKLGDKACPLLWDVADIALAKGKMRETVDILGGLDILVNNAGVFSTVPFESVDETDWDSVMGTNIKGMFFICQAAEKYLAACRKDRAAKIINITSIRGFQGDTAPYGISKWGANGLTRGLARELISRNILVNGIAPGVVATGINNINVRENAYGGALNQRVALPEEIAELALFLASDAANNIVGQTIICDGGETLF